MFSGNAANSTLVIQHLSFVRKRHRGSPNLIGQFVAWKCGLMLF
jgi:hypothetical protein